MTVIMRDPNVLLPVTLSETAYKQVEKEIIKRGSGIGIRLHLQTA